MPAYRLQRDLAGQLGRIKLNPAIYVLLSLLLLQTTRCSKKPTDFRKFLGGSEIVYPGAPSQCAGTAG